ncbi:MAG: NUDIX domain-containing protein [Chloroflexi bacterium]|nr:NUDIX domain-containing protein [Chloroflexota bacterium]
MPARSEAAAVKVVCGQAVPGPDGVVRELTVAVFVVHRGQVLLLFHPKLGMWLPPGGHVEYGELPDDAAVREVLEETGVGARLVGERGLDVAYPYQLVRPQGVQVEDIRPSVQHIDLVYFGVPIDEHCAVAEECAARDRAGWYDAAELATLGANGEIQAWAAKAVRAVQAREHAGDGPGERPGTP